MINHRTFCIEDSWLCVCVCMCVWRGCVTSSLFGIESYTGWGIRNQSTLSTV